MYRSNNGFIRSLFLEGEGDASGNGAPVTETVQIQHGDETIELPASVLKPILEKQIADKYIPKASHNDQMGRMRKELDTYKGRPNPDDLLNDTEFKTKATQAWGLDPKAAKVEIAEQRTRLLAEINEREVKPREAKIGTLSEQVAKLRQKDLHGQIAQAANAVKVDEKFTRVPGKNAKSFIASMMENGFEYDEEHGEWFAKGTGGNKFAFSQTGDVPYMTVAEYFQVWSNGEGKDFLRNERQPGAEANPDGQRGGPVAGQVGKELRLTADQIRDIGFFKKMVEKAGREGLTIVPV
jgi:hypothetical protein